MRTYNEICRELDALTEQKRLCEALRDAGVPISKAHNYSTPYARSGYSMGENVKVYCNDIFIENYANTEEYAKSCKWQAKHGRVVLRFTKKALREYVDCNIAIRNLQGRNDYLKEADPYFEKKRELVKNAYVADESVVKKIRF